MLPEPQRCERCKRSESCLFRPSKLRAVYRLIGQEGAIHPPVENHTAGKIFRDDRNQVQHAFAIQCGWQTDRIAPNHALRELSGRSSDKVRDFKALQDRPSLTPDRPERLIIQADVGQQTTKLSIRALAVHQCGHGPGDRGFACRWITDPQAMKSGREACVELFGWSVAKHADGFELMGKLNANE